jgi:opacity protein-like surface antigen
MRVQHIVSGFLGLAACALAAAPAHAQSPMARPISFGIAGGVSQPIGDFGDGANTGFNVMGTLGFQPTAQVFGFRADVSYHRFGLDEESISGGTPGVNVDGNANIIAGVASVVMTISNSSGVRPYLIAGGGLYRLAVDADVSGGGVSESFDDSETDFGLAGGGGLSFPLGGMNAFIEARYHSVFSSDDDDEDSGNTNFIPVVIGIQF